MFRTWAPRYPFCEARFFRVGCTVEDDMVYTHGCIHGVVVPRCLVIERGALHSTVGAVPR